MATMHYPLANFPSLSLKTSLHVAQWLNHDIEITPSTQLEARDFHKVHTTGC